MISQEDLQSLIDFVYDAQSDKYDSNQRNYLQSVLLREKYTTAPGQTFWNYMQTWTCADMTDPEAFDELQEEFADEIDGAWLDHIAIEADERWGQDWSDCVEEVVNLIDDDHADLGDKLQEVIDYLDEQ